MKPCRPLLLVAFALMLQASGVAGADAAVETKKIPSTTRTVAPSGSKTRASAPVAATFDNTFRGIGDRNIFNPNRVGRTRSSEAPPPRTDVISFVGVMDYEKGLFAFFDSPDDSYRKALKVGGSLGKFTVKSIAADSVELERDAKPITLKMGQQLRRPEGGDWTLIGADVVRNEARAAEAASASASAPLAIPADASDALRRLMEKRMNQLKQ